MLNKIKVIGFDADDTLWINENFFRHAESQFADMMKQHASAEETVNRLYKIELQNIPLYGFGIKAFLLSVMETALELTNQKLDSRIVAKIVDMGKEMLQLPVELLPGAEKVLETLLPHHTLVLATKGDLHDQQRKLRLSGLKHYFDHVEIMSDKTTVEYAALLRKIRLEAKNFMMVGNSLKSDILPVLKLGGTAVHIPYHITWAHEEINETIDHPRFFTVNSMEDFKTVFMESLNGRFRSN